MFIINKIQGNSGEGSPVFSKQALEQNTHFMAFKNTHRGAQKPMFEENSINHKLITDKLQELSDKQKFGVRNLTVN
jgi:hypothetical protein